MSKSGFQISTNVQATAILAINSCIDTMDRTDPWRAVLQKVVAKKSDLRGFQYGEGAEDMYLGAQYEYTSEKDGKITYFVGVKGDQFCIGTVTNEVVTELQKQNEGKAIERFNRTYQKPTPNLRATVKDSFLNEEGLLATGEGEEAEEADKKRLQMIGNQIEALFLQNREVDSESSYGLDEKETRAQKIFKDLESAELEVDVAYNLGEGVTFEKKLVGAQNGLQSTQEIISVWKDEYYLDKEGELVNSKGGAATRSVLGLIEAQIKEFLELHKEFLELIPEEERSSDEDILSQLSVGKRRPEIGNREIYEAEEPGDKFNYIDTFNSRISQPLQQSPHSVLGSGNRTLNETSSLSRDTQSREADVIASMWKRVPGDKKGPKTGGDENWNAAYAFLAIARSWSKQKKAPEGLKFVSDGDGKYEGFIYKNADDASVFVGFESTRAFLGIGFKSKKMLFGAMKVSEDGKITAVANDGSLAELRGKLPSDLGEQVEVDILSPGENSFDQSDMDPLQSDRDSLGRLSVGERRSEIDEEGQDDTFNYVDTFKYSDSHPIRTLISKPLQQSLYSGLGGGSRTSKRVAGGLSPEALLSLRIQSPLEEKKLEDDMFSEDDQSLKPTSKRTETSRNAGFEDRGKEKKEDYQATKIYQPPYQRSVSGIITANPGNNDTGFGVFTTSQNSEIQKLVKAMESESSATGLPKATSNAFKIIVEHFARRKEKAGLPKGINCIEHGNVAQGLYTAFHFYANGRDVVVGFKSALQQDDSAMERSLEPFFGTAELNTGIITAIHEEEGGKFLPALQSQLNSPFNRIAEVDNLTLKAVVSDLMGGVTNQDHLDLGGGLKLVPVVHIDANNAKVAAVTGSGAEYSIVVTKGEAQVEEPKMVTLSGRSTKAASSKVARDVEDRCGKLLKQKRTFEWMSEVALGYHHPDLAISIGATTTDEEIEDAARTQAVYDTFKESLKTMGDKTAIDKALEVSVSESKGGFDYVQNGVKKHFGIDESGRLVFLKEQSGQQVSVQPKDLKDADIDALVTLMGFDKGLFRATLADKRDDLFHQRDNLLLKERPEGLSPLSNRWDGHPSSSSRGAFPNRHENHFDERVDILRSRPRVSSLRETTGGSLTNPLYNQRGIHPSSSVSKPEAYRFGGEQVQVYSYQNNAERTVLQRGSQLIKAIVEKPKEAEVVRDSIVANAIIVAAAKNGLTPAQAIAIIKFSIDQRGFSNMRGDRTRINLANEFAENSVGLSPEGPRDDPGFRAMAKFSADFQKETTKAGLKRWDSEFEEGKRDGLNSSDIPISAINMMRRRIDAGTLDPDKIFTSEDVSGSKSEIENAAVKSNQSRSSGR